MLTKELKKSLTTGLAVLVLYTLAQPLTFALTYDIPSNGDVVGKYQKVRFNDGDTLVDIAEEYDIGLYALIKANPHLNNKALKNGATVIIPSQFILPSGPREGIVLNLADMRVFFYHPDGDKVSTYPVGIGRQGWSTPLGTTRIVSKEKHPAWYPPESIRREAESRGKELPKVVPAGPNNPLGQYAMHLGFKGILMHGTNDPGSVGLRSSHGCIRLFADDIENLFSMAPIGTQVRVVYEPHHNE